MECMQVLTAYCTADEKGVKQPQRMQGTSASSAFPTHTCLQVLALAARADNSLTRSICFTCRGTIAVYSCPSSCSAAPVEGPAGHSAYVEEFVWVQPS